MSRKIQEESPPDVAGHPAVEEAAQRLEAQGVLSRRKLAQEAGISQRQAAKYLQRLQNPGSGEATPPTDSSGPPQAAPARRHFRAPGSKWEPIPDPFPARKRAPKKSKPRSAPLKVQAPTKVPGIPDATLAILDLVVVELLEMKEWLEPNLMVSGAYGLFGARVPLKMAELWLERHRLEGPLAYLAFPPPPTPIRDSWAEMEEVARTWPARTRLTVPKLAAAAKVTTESASGWFRHQRLLRMEETRRSGDASTLQTLKAFAQAAQVTMGQALYWARRQHQLARAARALGPGKPTVSRLGRAAYVTNQEAARWLEAWAAGDPGVSREVASDYLNAPTREEQEKIFPSRPGYRENIRAMAEARRWSQ